MAGNPDFRLIVGADVNLSYQQMKTDLNEVIKRIGSDPIKIKVGLDQASSKEIQKELDTALSGNKAKTGLGLKLDTSAFKDFQDRVTSGLNEISRLIGEINSKSLGLNLNISGDENAKEQIAGVRGEVLAYAKALEQAQNEVINLYNRKFGGALAEQGADIGKAVGVIVNYRTELSRITESIDKQNTLTGLKIRRDELEQLRAAIVPVIEAANKLGATNFDIKRLIPTDIPANVVSSADKVSELFSKLGAIGGGAESGAKQQTEAISETVRVLQEEMRKVTEVSEKYDAHKLAVEAAAQAEATKARESADVAGALRSEEAATDRATGAAKRHAESVDKNDAALQKMVDSLGAYEARFSKLGDNIAHMGGAPSKELEAAYDRLRSLLNTMKSDTSSEQDKINASKDWAKAVQEVTERVSAEEQVYTRAKKAEAQAAKEQAQAAKEEAAAEAARVKEQEELSAQAEKAAQSLERLYESTLKISDGTKLSTEDLNKMIDLLRQAQDVTLDPSQRQAALNEFNKVLESTTFRVKELIRTEKEEAEAVKQSEQEKKRAYAAEVQKQNLLKQAQSLLQRVTTAQTNWTKAASNSATKDAYAGLEDYKKELNDIISKFESGSMAPEEFRQKLATLNTEFAKSSQVITGAGTAVKGYFGKGLEQLGSRLSYTFGFAAIVTKTVAEIRKMITTAVELDTAMNNLQIVTRGSNDDMAAYSKTVSQMAKETAQSTKDLIDATTVYARLGYTMDESATLAKFTAQLQNVGRRNCLTA